MGKLVHQWMVSRASSPQLDVGVTGNCDDIRRRYSEIIDLEILGFLFWINMSAGEGEDWGGGVGLTVLDMCGEILLRLYIIG